MAARALLVYAVCRPPRKGIAAAGMRGEPLALFGAEGLAAVTGDLPRPPKPTVPTLRKYDAVLRALAEELPAVLPARFGTCMASSEELAFVLRARDASLRAALRDVRGRVQMTLRSVVPAGSEDVPPPGAAPDRASGLAYLRSLAAEASRARDVPALAPVIAAVRGWVRAERVVRSGQVASVYHLIPRGSVQAYARAARSAAEAAGVRVVLTGPFPAYAFGEV
jgi:hypothetical protein